MGGLTRPAWENGVMLDGRLGVNGEQLANTKISKHLASLAHRGAGAPAGAGWVTFPQCDGVPACVQTEKSPENLLPVHLGSFHGPDDL